MSVPYHAWTHRPKARGGTDPIEITGYPICFRAAIGAIADPEGDRTHYPSGDGGDAVYWDTWDTTYDTSVYETNPYEQTINGIDVIGGVQLSKVGIYSIHAQIDLHDFYNGLVLFSSSFDQGQAVYSELNNVAPGDDFLGDFEMIRLDHWRIVDSLPAPDTELGGDATSVEIIFAHNCSASVNYYGANIGVGSPLPVADADVWIPGGYDGAWGYVPNLLVMYWGPTGLDPDWPDSIVKAV